MIGEMPPALKATRLSAKTLTRTDLHFKKLHLKFRIVHYWQVRDGAPISATTPFVHIALDQRTTEHNHRFA